MTTRTLPLSAGVGLKPEHFEAALNAEESGLWFEVHTENYLLGGGPRLEQLSRLRESYRVSFHGVGASLGTPQQMSERHLSEVRRLVDRFEPHQISEHAVWSSFGNVCFADLLPLPRTREALQSLAEGVDRYQSAIGRSIVIENPTNYLPFVSEMHEPDFLLEVSQRTGCGLLLDISNLYLSERNCGIDAKAYIEKLCGGCVQEIHIAGFDPDPNFGERLLIDSHAAAVGDEVWTLLEFALRRLGAQPVLLERDAKLPPFVELMKERGRAQRLVEQCALGQSVA